MQDRESLEKSGMQINLTQFQPDQPNSESQQQQQQPGFQSNVPEPMLQQIEDDLTALRNKQNRSPLQFYFKISSSYVISYNPKEFCNFMCRFAILSVFLIAVQIFVQLVADVPQQLKAFLIFACVVQILSFLFLFYLDPGTLFQDEPEKINEERLYCQICRVYKSYKTRHCRYCFKCVKGFDHHCGFFAKCIGRRNYLLFCLFMVISGINGGGCMGSLMYTALKGTLW